MGRNRVLSFMSQFSAGAKTPPRSSSPTNDSPPPQQQHQQQHRQPQRKRSSTSDPFPDHDFDNYRPVTPPSRPDYGTPVEGSPATSPPRRRSTSRPSSMVFAHQPPIMDISEDTIPELLPIFSFLNSHSNKLYQEGYFLKLEDQNTQGKPNPDRIWTECFAQLVGTVLSLWDAAELDAAGEDGEVLPKFINLTDASIKMIESLPTRTTEEQPLQHILSISTAGRNRYLLHFNSHHSLIQWTAGIRLAIYEHTTLQEAYTGALIAGKGKSLNNINVIMERSRVKTEEWVRVRFGAGVPWRRCWCVITPPDEKEHAKLQKELKKKSPYDRAPVPTLKGTIKFYDTRKDGKKQKKAQPIASIDDAYSAYAIYPQAKSLVDASTLLKIEGNISIHTDPPSSTEGFVFIMPEVHPAVSGFEMLLRFLFPTWDTFGLYGRPGKLVASVLDSRSLMFAMPKHKSYGYLEVMDVSNLILQDGSAGWNEREWRKHLKESTGTRMNQIDDRRSESRSRSGSRSGSRSARGLRLSFGDTPQAASKPRVGFSEEKGATRSSRSFSLGGGGRNDSAPPGQRNMPPTMPGAQSHHTRNSSDPNVPGGAPPPRQDYGRTESPYGNQGPPRPAFQDRMGGQSDYLSSDDERNAPAQPFRELEGMRQMHTPEPVSRPPAFNHAAEARPASKVYHSPELRRANSRLSNTTLDQLAKAGGIAGPSLSDSRRDGENAGGSGPSVLSNANFVGTSANDNRSREVLSPHNQNPASRGLPPPLNLAKQRSRSPLPPQSPYGAPSPYGRGDSKPGSRPGTAEGRRSPMPPGAMPAGAPRSPHPQNPNFRPDQGRPPPGFGPGGPQDGRGRPPNQRGPPNGPPTNQRGPPPNGPPPNGPPGQRRPPPNGPPGQRGPPNGPPGQRGPPGGPPPHGPPGGFDNYRQGPPQSPRIPGPPGSQGPHGGAPSQNHRKPLPDRSPPAPGFENQKPSTMSGISVITTNEIIDHYARDQSRPREPPRQGTPGSDRRPPPPQRQASGNSSHYDDDSSAKSIDYASTHKSDEPKKSIERPRAGVLKTVGGDDPDMPPKPSFDIPEINFGRTLNYGAPQQKSQTPAALVPGGVQNQRPYTPVEQRPTPPAHRPSGSPHGRNESDEAKRTMAWQPRHVATRSGQGLSAEQYVQQKAAHARTPSGHTLGGMLSTGSPDRLGGGHSRSSSSELLSRPGSRGANSALGYGGSTGPSGSGNVSSQLSAREQEQLARMTGGPLINVGGHQRTDSQSSGLVGAIEAREREKQQMRPGAHTQAVQQAVSQRQQQQVAMAYQQQMAQQQMAQQQMMQQQMAQQQMAQQQMAQQMAQHQAFQQQQHIMADRSMSAQGMYSQMGEGGYGGSQSPPPQAGYGGQAASFSRPLRTGPQPQQDPRVPPQGQYGAGGPPPASRNMHPQYQGQAF